MAMLEDIFAQEAVQGLGWTLVHFVWQGTVAALFLAILLRLLRKSAANVRYLICCLALGVIVLLPVVTIKLISISMPTTASVERTAVDLPMSENREMPVMEMPAADKPARVGSVSAVPAISWKEVSVELLEMALPYIVLGWLAGVLVLSVWHLGGWTQLQRLRRRMVKQVDASLHKKLTELSELLGVRQAVQIMESALVQVPTVVGWLRPVILLPASALSGLSCEQLEAILAHELAHIRRLDYLVNMLQTVVEILGFYHPAVWWVSHKIRVERENCCDDLAVSISGNRVRYARALTLMEETRASQLGFAVAASGGSLFSRICRLVGKDHTNKEKAGWVPSVIAILLVLAMVIPTGLALTAPKNQETDMKVQVEGAENLGRKKVTVGQVRSGWRKEFDEVYRLEEGEVLRRIAPPFIPERKEYYKQEESDQASIIPEPPDYFTFHWDGGLKPWGLGFTSGKRPLDSVLRNNLSIGSDKFEGPAELLEIQVPGDWIVRKNSTTGERLKGLEKTLKNEIGREIHFVKREVEREVIVAEGKFEFRPLSEVQNKSRVHIYADKLDPDSRGGGSSGTVSELLQFLGSLINMMVIDQTKSSGDVDFTWDSHRSSYLRKMKASSSEYLQKLEMLLKNLERQTNLKFNRELRMVEKWFVVEGDAEPDVKIDAQVEKETASVDRQVKSARMLKRLGLLLSMYAADHQGEFPDDLFKLGPYATEEDAAELGPSVEEDTKYVGEGKTSKDSPQTVVIAYDKSLLQEGNGTNVLFADGHVEFIRSNELGKLGIIAESSNLEVMDVKIDPIRQGKNVVRVEVKNNSEEDQMFRIQIYSRSPDLGRSGVGWGTSFFESIKPKETKWTRFVFKIQGPITDATYVRLDFHNPGPTVSFDRGKWSQGEGRTEWFKRVRYASSDLEQYKPDESRVKPASDRQAKRIRQAFENIQSYIREGEYEKAWALFTKDYQQAEYQFSGFEGFKRAMEPTHQLQSAFLWEKEDFLNLEPKSVVIRDELFALAATYKGQVWTIDFAQENGQWKIDWVAGYAPRVLQWQNWEERLLPKMEKRGTEHFDIYYYKDSTAAKEIEQIAEQKEKGFEEICKFLGKDSDVRICMVFFEDGKTKQLETGHQGAGWAYGHTIVEIYNEEEKLDPYHETVHILMGPYGGPPAMFTEGFATYMSERLGAHGLENLGGGEASLYGRVRELKEKGEWIELEELVTYTDIGPEWSRPPISYAEAGAFVKFLIDSYGKDKFLRAYKTLTNSDEKAEQQQNVKELEQIYGKSLQELEKGWEGAFSS